MFFSSPFSCFTFDDILTLVLFLRVFLLSRFGLHIVFCCQRSVRSLLKTFLLSIFRSTSETSPKSFTFYLLSDKRWRWGDSNPWPMPCKGTALPAELHPPSPIRNAECGILNYFPFLLNSSFRTFSFRIPNSSFRIALCGPFRTRTWDLALIRGAL